MTTENHPMTKLHLLLLCCGLALMLGCPSSDDDDDDDDSGAPPGDDDTGGSAFEAGQFAFATYAVDDGCLNGAAEAIYMPQGPAVPEAWDDPLEIPSFDSLPSTYTIQLPDPIGALEITLEQGQGDQFVLQQAELIDMLFDEATYPDCIVDATVSATLNVQSDDHITGSVTLTNTNYEGATCPAVVSDPCDVMLDVQGDRM